MAERLMTRPNLEAMKRHAQIFPEFRKEDVLQLVAWTEHQEQELSRLRSCVNLTPEQANEIAVLLRRYREDAWHAGCLATAERLEAAAKPLSTPQPPVKEQPHD